MDSLPDALVELRMLADREAISAYAALTDDYNPIHLDPEFAATTSMAGIIAHGTMSVSLLWQALAETIGAQRLGGTELEARFIHPVRCGSVVVVGGTRQADQEGIYNVWAKTTDDVTVLEGIARVGKLSD